MGFYGPSIAHIDPSLSLRMTINEQQRHCESFSPVKNEHDKSRSNLDLWTQRIVSSIARVGSYGTLQIASSQSLLAMTTGGSGDKRKEILRYRSGWQKRDSSVFLLCYTYLPLDFLQCRISHREEDQGDRQENVVSKTMSEQHEDDGE
jgi:hypothetical protein